MKFNFKEFIKKQKEFNNLPVRILMVSRYKGKGRPKKSDYQHCSMEQMLDVKLLDTILCGFTTSYVK